LAKSSLGLGFRPGFSSRICSIFKRSRPIVMAELGVALSGRIIVFERCSAISR